MECEVVNAPVEVQHFLDYLKHKIEIKFAEMDQRTVNK